MKKALSVLTLSLLITTFGASTAFAGEGYYMQQKMQEQSMEKQTSSQETCESKKHGQEACNSKEQNEKIKQEKQIDETNKQSITPSREIRIGR